MARCTSSCSRHGAAGSKRAPSGTTKTPISFNAGAPLYLAAILGSCNELDADETHQLDETTAEGFNIAWKAIQDLDLQRFETVRLKGEPLIEQKIWCDFLPKLPFYGTPDWVVKDRQSGGIFPIDYKVRESLQPVTHEEVDLQLPAYQYLLLSFARTHRGKS